MTEDEKKQHALRIAKGMLFDAEFSLVYEDEELEGASEDDMRDIHNMIYSEVKVVHGD